MIYNVGTSQAVGTVPAGSGASILPVPLSGIKWRALLYHHTGGTKAEWIMGQNIPITSINFELNLHGCGAGDFTLAWVDIPIDADDYLIVFYNGEPIYQGIVNVTPDVKGGTIELLPRAARADEILYSGTFTGQTIDQILYSLITNATISTDSKWIYDVTKISTGTAATFTITYDNETLKEILDGLAAQCSGRFWGVDASNIFFFLPMESAATATMFQCEQPAIGAVQSEANYDGIEATRYEVYRKTTGASGTGYAGSAGPPSGIENIYRKRTKKLTVPDTLANDAAAVTYATGLLATYQPYNSIQVDNIILDRFFPSIFKRVIIEDQESLQLRTIETCEDITQWSGETLETSNYVEGAGAMYISSALSGASMTWLPTLSGGVPYRFKGMKKIVFMAWSTNAGGFVSVILNVLTPNPVTINIFLPNGAAWNAINLNYSGPIETMTFLYNSAPLTINKLIIDRIQVFAYHKKQYEENIIQANFTIEPGNENVSMKLREYDQALNDKIFALEKLTGALQTSIAG